MEKYSQIETKPDYLLNLLFAQNRNPCKPNVSEIPYFFSCYCSIFSILLCFGIHKISGE